MKHFSILLSLMFMSAASANDRTIDLSSGCKIYRLENKAWVETDAGNFEGISLAPNQVVRDAKFTVFRTAEGTFGVNQKCVTPASPGSAPADSAAARPPTAAPAQRARPVARRRAAAKPVPEVVAVEKRSPWSVGFSLGYNLSPSGKVTEVEGSTTTVREPKFASTLSIMGEASYRMSSLFRIAAEMGLSQLQDSSNSGNETSFIDFRPELTFQLSPKTEIYLGPMLGLYFLTQNTSAVFKQQNATAVLVGLAVGADYALNEQFDLGLFVRYFKPGDLKLTGTNAGVPVTGTISVAYQTIGARFMIHF